VGDVHVGRLVFLLSEACREHGWELCILPERSKVSASIQGGVGGTQFLNGGVTLDAALEALWADVKTWAKARAATGSGR
jgi:hypothetical protein